VPKGERGPNAYAVKWNQVLLDAAGVELTIFFDSGENGSNCGLPVDVEVAERASDVSTTIWVQDRGTCELGGVRATRVRLQQPLEERTLHNGACLDQSPLEPCGPVVDVPGAALRRPGGVSYLDWPLEP
jgi:hypothetical protein